MGHAFSEKFGTTCQIFRKKTKKYHAAAGEIRHYREQTVRLNAHRVSPVIYTSYAVIVPEEHVASGRAEQDILFQEILAHSAKIS
jgi:hypothetical protein